MIRTLPVVVDLFPRDPVMTSRIADVPLKSKNDRIADLSSEQSGHVQ
jgi:hypothetical protein